jgi:hypothetical protein
MAGWCADPFVAVNFVKSKEELGSELSCWVQEGL